MKRGGGAHGGGNLPAEVTSFVGRRRELTDVKRALSKSRLVTLTGVGGVGKTRVAERVARDRRRAYPHGVWLVELGELPDPALLTQTVLTQLGVRGQPSGDALRVLIDSLSSRQLLLVLDNCEHLLDEVAALVDWSELDQLLVGISASPKGEPGWARL